LPQNGNGNGLDFLWSPNYRNEANVMYEDLFVTRTIVLPAGELVETFVRASKPGGQNVNKVSTAVELRFDAKNSTAIPGDVFARLRRIAGSRVTKDGEVLIRAERFRNQERNRVDARERLAELIRRAATPPRPRKDTLPTRSSKERRLTFKARRGQTKALRRNPPDH
jgi:ribosome-associated protein